MEIKKALHLSIHPRVACNGNCTGCYLKRQYQNAENIYLDENTMYNNLSKVKEFYRNNNYDEMTIATMVNTNDPDIMYSDGKCLEYAIKHMKEMNITCSEIYTSSNIFTLEHASIKSSNILSKLALICNTIKQSYGISSMIWLSDIHTIPEGEMNEVSSWLTLTEKNLCQINGTITIHPNIDIIHTVEKICEISSFMERKPSIYLDIWDDNCSVWDDSVNKTVELMNILIYMDFEVEPDFCMLGEDIDDYKHKVITIMPDGAIQNCPYLPYKADGNSNLDENFCYNKCPHRKNRKS